MKKDKEKTGIKKNPTVKKGLLTALIGSAILLSLPAAAQVQAQEEASDAGNVEITELNQIMNAREDLEVKAAPDETAETVFRYQGGDNVYVTGQTSDGWYRVRYQDIVGYIQAAQVAELELDVAALNEEFAVEEMEGALVVEEVERYRTEARRSRIWGTIIILLVAGVFATGIISTVRSGKKKEIPLEIIDLNED